VITKNSKKKAVKTGIATAIPIARGLADLSILSRTKPSYTLGWSIFVEPINSISTPNRSTDGAQSRSKNLAGGASVVATIRAPGSGNSILKNSIR
jgi:hypothetical protein